jgi:hypothetical protein
MATQGKFKVNEPKHVHTPKKPKKAKAASKRPAA